MYDSALNGGVQLGPSRKAKIAGAGPARTLVAIMIAQSNGVPHELSSSLLDASYAAAYPNVQMRMKSAPDPLFAWETYDGDMSAVTFNGATRIGAYASLMRDLDEALPNGWALLVHAVGGADSVDLDSIWASETLPLLASTMSDLGCTDLAVVPIHGEADSRDLTKANNYDTWFLGKIAALRAIYPTAIVSFLKLNVNVSAFYTYKAEQRVSHDNIAAALTNGGMVTADDLGVPDGVHYVAGGPPTAALPNGVGLIEIGSRLAVPIAAAKGLFLKPIALFTTSILQRAVTFTDVSVGRGATIASRVWTPGGAGTWTSGTANSSPSTFTYTADGTYNSSLSITDSNGRTVASSAVPVSVIGGITGVTRDAIGTNYVPANATELRTFFDDATVGLAAKSTTNNSIWNEQEASGNLADSGSAGIALAASSAPAYGVTLASMSRKGTLCADGTAKLFSSTSASLPDISVDSAVLALQGEMPSAAPTVNRSIAQLGTGANRCYVGIEATTGKLQVKGGSGAIALSAGSVCNGARFALVLRVRRGVLEVDVSLENGTSIKVTATPNSGMTGKRIHQGAQDGALSAAAAIVSWAALIWGQDWTSAEGTTLAQKLRG